MGGVLLLSGDNRLTENEIHVDISTTARLAIRRMVDQIIRVEIRELLGESTEGVISKTDAISDNRKDGYVMVEAFESTNPIFERSSKRN